MTATAEHQEPSKSERFCRKKAESSGAVREAADLIREYPPASRERCWEMLQRIIQLLPGELPREAPNVRFDALDSIVASFYSDRSTRHAHLTVCHAWERERSWYVAEYAKRAAIILVYAHRLNRDLS